MLDEQNKMAAEKKTFLQRLKTKSEGIKQLFTKKDKDKLQKVNEDSDKMPKDDMNEVSELNTKENRVESENPEGINNVNDTEKEEDELKNFTFKIVHSTDSVSSHDSGYLDNYNKEDEECIDEFIKKKVVLKEPSEDHKDQRLLKNVYDINSKLNTHDDKNDKTLQDTYKNTYKSYSRDDKKLEPNKSKSIVTKNERNDYYIVEINDTKSATDDDVIIKFENLNLYGKQNQKRSEHVLISKNDKKDACKITDDVTKRLESLNLESGNKKNGQLVVLARPPHPPDRKLRPHPYEADTIENKEGNANMINHVNRKFFSGGNLIVNSALNTQDKIRDNSVQYFQSPNYSHPVDNVPLFVSERLDDISSKKWELGLLSPIEHNDRDIYDVQATSKENYDVEVPTGRNNDVEVLITGTNDVEVTSRSKNDWTPSFDHVSHIPTPQNENETDEWNTLMEIIRKDTKYDTVNLNHAYYPQVIKGPQNADEVYQNSPQYLTCLNSLIEDTPENSPIDDFLKALIVEPLNEANYTELSSKETNFRCENDNIELRDIESYVNLYPTPPRAEHSPVQNESMYYPWPNQNSPRDFHDSNRQQIQSSPKEFYENRQQIQSSPSKNYENSLTNQTSRPADSVQSSITESPTSIWSFDTTSPSLSSPNSIYDNFQEIQPIEEGPITTSLDSEKDYKPKAVRKCSLKQYKEMQKKVADFSNEECCKNRTSCKEFFQERFNRLETEEQKRLLVKVAGLDWKNAYGVFHHVLRTLSNAITSRQDAQYALFAIICELILSKWTPTYTTRYGLELLKKAALDCPHSPILTRYLVRCIRLALKQLPDETRTCVFTEAEFGRNSLVWDCVKGGDKYAAVLAELFIKEDADVPLFNVSNDDEGYSPLHVACLEHSAVNSRLHTAHVLLTHGAMDLWKGDVKGNDTAVHLAVNSATCDLSLILLLFSYAPCGHWTKLAHLKNRCNLSPKDYANRAVKPGNRQNYPAEVLEFLQKRPKQTNE